MYPLQRIRSVRNRLDHNKMTRGGSDLPRVLPIMIYPHSNETQTRWDHGDYKVQLMLPNNPRPIGFCDGTDADLAEMSERAEAEGAESIRVEKKTLKSGRGIWTLHSGD